MFFEMLAANALDPATDSPPPRVRRDGAGGFRSAGVPMGSCPEVQLTGHLQRKSINGKRITLNHIRQDGKPHYIGLPGVLK